MTIGEDAGFIRYLYIRYYVKIIHPEIMKIHDVKSMNVSCVRPTEVTISQILGTGCLERNGCAATLMTSI